MLDIELLADNSTLNRSSHCFLSSTVPMRNQLLLIEELLYVMSHVSFAAFKILGLLIVFL